MGGNTHRRYPRTCTGADQSPVLDAAWAIIGVWPQQEGDANSLAGRVGIRKEKERFRVECLRKADVSGRRGCLGEEAGQMTRVQRGCLRTHGREPLMEPEGLEGVLEEVGRQ